MANYEAKGTFKMYCPLCIQKKYYMRQDTLHAHCLFDHGFLMPVCSTGIIQKQEKRQTIYKRRIKESISSYKGRGIGGNTHGNSCYTKCPQFFNHQIRVLKAIKKYGVYK